MRKLFLFLAMFFTVAIAVGSLVSLDSKPLPQVQVGDKLIHVVGYGLLAMSWLLAYKHLKNKLLVSLWIGLFVLIYGIVIEVLQGALTAHRQADLFDMFANFVGILTAIIFFNFFFSQKKS